MLFFTRKDRCLYGSLVARANTLNVSFTLTL